MRLSTELNTDSLSPDESRKIQALVDSSDFFNLPVTISPSRKGADQFSYVITIEKGKVTRTIQVGETVLPPGLRPLISYLMDKTKNR